MRKKRKYFADTNRQTVIKPKKLENKLIIMMIDFDICDFNFFFVFQ